MGVQFNQLAKNRVGGREGLQPECPLGKPHVNRPLLKSEFQNVFPLAKTLGDRWGNQQIQRRRGNDGLELP